MQKNLIITFVKTVTPWLRKLNFLIFVIFDSIYVCNHVSSSMFLNPTNAFEICCIINQLNINKIYGSDGAETKFIVHAFEVLSPVLLILLNACFDFEIFPTNLKTAKVLFIRLVIKMK